VKTEQERARARELYVLSKDKILARRRELNAAMSPGEKERRRLRNRELYAQNRVAIRARARELAAARSKRGPEPIAPPAPPPMAAHCYTSEAPAPELDKQLRDALRRLVAVARRVQNLANYRAAAETVGKRGKVRHAAPGTSVLVEEHIRTAYKRLHMARQDQRP
jgi:hypothetical protein